jgi:hypothetical protein
MRSIEAVKVPKHQEMLETRNGELITCITARGREVFFFDRAAAIQIDFLFNHL